MKKRDHDQIMRDTVRRMKARHTDEIERATAFWQGEADTLHEIVETYAEGLDEQDALITRMRAVLVQALDWYDKGEAFSWSDEARQLLSETARYEQKEQV